MPVAGRLATRPVRWLSSRVRTARLRREATALGLNPNEWFDNVEIVAAKRVGRETVHYVSNIYKYYVAYRLIADRLKLRGDAAVSQKYRIGDGT